MSSVKILGIKTKNVFLWSLEIDPMTINKTVSELSFVKSIDLGLTVGLYLKYTTHIQFIFSKERGR